MLGFWVHFVSRATWICGWSICRACGKEEESPGSLQRFWPEQAKGWVSLTLRGLLGAGGKLQG